MWNLTILVILEKLRHKELRKKTENGRRVRNGIMCHYVEVWPWVTSVVFRSLYKIECLTS